MRHATFLAIATLSGQYIGTGPPNIKACDWIEVSVYATAFGVGDAEQLLGGRLPWSGIPTCPRCAVFVDMALESR